MISFSTLIFRVSCCNDQFQSSDSRHSMANEFRCVICRCLFSLSCSVCVYVSSGDCSLLIHRERMKLHFCQLVAIVSAATKQTSIMYCIAGWLVVSSVTLCGRFFSSLLFSLSRSHQPRPSVCCCDGDARCVPRLFSSLSLSLSLFFRFTRRCRRRRHRRLTTHTLSIYIHFILLFSSSPSSSSLFSFARYLKGETQFKIASHSSLQTYRFARRRRRRSREQITPHFEH